MKIVRIDRFAFGENGTFGRLRLYDAERALFECFSLELPVFPWVRENARDIAAIPVGDYVLTPGVFFRNTADPTDDYPCLVIPDGEVSDRGPGLKIHAGNTILVTLGCPLVGDAIWFMADRPGVRNSRRTLSRLVDTFGKVPGRLVVREMRAEDIV